MSKVTIIGAGNVGTTCVNVLATREVANELILIDIKEGFAEGKALDIFQSATLLGFDIKMEGVTLEWKKSANSDVIVVISGVPRKATMPMTEEPPPMIRA